MVTTTRSLLTAIAVTGVLLGSSAHAATLNGDRGADIINGTRYADKIDGRGGDDTLHGRGGPDTVVGGAGNDFIESFTRDNQADKLYGGPGHDSFTVGKGDNAFGGTGRDDFNVITGGRGTWVDCGAGRDIVNYLAEPRPSTRGCETVRFAPVG